MTIAVATLRGIGGGVHPAASNGVSPLVPLLLMLGLVAISVLIVWRASRRWERDSGDSDKGDSGGGGGGSGPTPRHPSPEGDPGWWPEFEREFAAYVNEQRARPDTPITV